jgi:hypothetical protein
VQVHGHFFSLIFAIFCLFFFAENYMILHFCSFLHIFFVSKREKVFYLINPELQRVVGKSQIVTVGWAFAGLWNALHDEP